MSSDEENEMLHLDSFFPKKQSEDGTASFFDESSIYPPSGVGLGMDLTSFQQVSKELARLF